MRTSRGGRAFKALAFSLALAFLLVSPREALAAVSVTPATGGTNLAVGTFVTLTGPIISEANPGEIGTGIITLRAPAGFEFDPSQTVTATAGTASGNCGGTRALQLGTGSASQTVTPTASQMTITVSRASSTTGANSCQANITWSGIRVKATTAPSSGNITKAAGGSVISGVTNGTTNFGTLSAAQTLSLTLSANSADFGTGLAPDGAASSLPAVASYPNGNAGAFYVRNGGAGAYAVAVTVNSSTAYTGTVAATENSGTAGMMIVDNSLRWRLGDMTTLAEAQGGTAFSTGANNTAFSAASSCSSGSPGQPGVCTYNYDYSLRVLWTDAPGTFNSIVTYTVTP